jgi:hypothetical protein
MIEPGPGDHRRPGADPRTVGASGRRVGAAADRRGLRVRRAPLSRLLHRRHPRPQRPRRLRRRCARVLRLARRQEGAGARGRANTSRLGLCREADLKLSRSDRQAAPRRDPHVRLLIVGQAPLFRSAARRTGALTEKPMRRVVSRPLRAFSGYTASARTAIGLRLPMPCARQSLRAHARYDWIEGGVVLGVGDRLCLVSPVRNEGGLR